MAQKLIRKTKGLYRNTNELSESPEGSLLVATNVVIDRDSIIETRRGIDKLFYKFRDTADRALNLFIYKDELIAHNSTDLMSYYDPTPINLTADITATSNIITNIAPNTDSLAIGQTIIGSYQFTVTTVADVAGSLNNKYFLLNAAGNVERYYVWFNVNAAGINPNIANRVPLQVNLSTNANANAVASAIAAIVNPLADFAAAAVGNVVTVTNSATGDADIARNGSGLGNPNFVFNNIGTGVPAGTVIDSIDSASQVTISNAVTATRILGNISVAGWRVYNGTYTQPDSTLGRIRSVTANQNFYFVSNTGVKKLDSLNSLIKSSGGIKAIDGEASVTGSSGFMLNNTQVAYRVIWGYIDANNNQILGVPSERITAINASGGSRDVELTIYIPEGITEDYFFQLYRSEQSADATVQASDELRLVYEDNPSSTDLLNKSLVVVDNTPEDLRDGAFIYTAPSQETILQANEIPPFATDVAVFQNCMFYANTRTRQRLTLTMLAVGGTSGVNYKVDTGATYINATTFSVTDATGIAVGMSITGPGTNIPLGLTVSQVSGLNIVVTGGTLTIWGGSITVQFRDVITIGGVTYTTNNLTQSIFDVTFTAGVPGKVNATAHGLTAHSTVVFSTTGTLPTGLVAGTVYYVRTPTANDFEISATQDGTSITLVDTGTGTHEALANSRRFKVFTTGTPGENIDDTAKALRRVVNSTNSNTTIYAYNLSGPDELPGKILFEGRNIAVAQFSATSTSHGSAWNPVLPATGTTVSSSNDSFSNGLYFSKPLQPEAVPTENFLRIGDADKAILRIIVLRDSLFVFKQDGIFRVLGTNPSDFRFDLLDNTAKLIAPETAVKLSNQIFCLADQGVAAISDTGVEIVSRQIENDFLNLFSLDQDAIATKSFAIGYESDRKYVLAIISNEDDEYPTQMYVYNTFTKAWVKWELNKSCGIVNPANDRLLFGDASSNSVNTERKARDFTDYVDDELYKSIVSFSNKTLNMLDVVNVQAGDLIYQGNTFVTKIETVDITTNVVTVQDTIDWVPLEPVTILKAIEVTVQYIPEEADNPGVSKQFREISLFFKEGFFDNLQLSFFSDLSGNLDTVSLQGLLLGFWGLFPWGSLPWGGASRSINIRTYIPAEKQRCSQITVRLRHREGFNFFALNGLSLIYNEMSERLKR